jgi:hypothetical protein
MSGKPHVSWRERRRDWQLNTFAPRDTPPDPQTTPWNVTIGYMGALARDLTCNRVYEEAANPPRQAPTPNLVWPRVGGI